MGGTKVIFFPKKVDSATKKEDRRSILPLRNFDLPRIQHFAQAVAEHEYFIRILLQHGAVLVKVLVR